MELHYIPHTYQGAKNRMWSSPPLLRLQVVKLGSQAKGWFFGTVRLTTQSLQNLAHTITMYLLISYCIYIAYIVPKCGRRRCRLGEDRIAARLQNGKARSGPRNLGSLPATRVPTIATASQIFRQALDRNAEIHKISCIRVLCNCKL